MSLPVTSELAAAILPGTGNVMAVTTLEAVLEDEMVRVDELSTLLDAARASVAETVDSAYPALLASTQARLKDQSASFGSYVAG
jgi:hypothetical protein